MHVDGAADTLATGLDYIFSFFESGHQRQRGKFDREVRQPGIFAAIASQHGILPAPSTTVLLTGSKGKGSCARLIAGHLQQAGKKTGLILTPEELSHLDRIRIDGEPIPPDAFLACLDALRPSLEAGWPDQHADFYHPPTSIFLLIGLMYFRAQGVDAVVIEGGRGARFDEIGAIPAAVGVVTSVLLEHAGKLGPGMREICADKLSLARNCNTLLYSDQVGDCAASFGIELPAANRVTPQRGAADGLPAWVATADALALAAVRALGLPVAPRPVASAPPSCQVLDAATSPSLRGRQRMFLDGAVGADCLDAHYMRSAQCSPGAIVVGLTRDKDVAAILAFLARNGFHQVYFFEAVSRTAHVAAPDLEVEWAGQFDTELGMDQASANALLALLDQHERVYALGVQVFLRSVRNALHVSQLGT